MKLLVLAFVSLTSLVSLAGVSNFKAGDLYSGDEVINDKLTGNVCYVQIEMMSDLSSRGLHCSQVSLKLLHNNALVPKDDLSLASRVTNVDTPEYKIQKTCAANLDGTITGNKIYSQNTEAIYTPLFIGGYDKGGVQYDYFLRIDGKTKLPKETYYHRMTWSSETLIGCVNLK